MGPSIKMSEHVLAVPDLARATAWWRDAAGFDVTLEIPGWVFLRLGEARLRIGECPDAQAVSTLGDHQYFAVFHVDDVDALHDRLIGAGASIRKPPTDEDWGLREMAVATPDGHRFMVVQSI